MAVQRSKNVKRREEVRRNIQRGGPAWLDAFRSREMGWATMFISVLTLLATLIAQSARSTLRYHVGEVIDEPVLSRVEFKAVDANETIVRKELAKQSEPAVYRFKPVLLEQLRDKLGGLLSLADQQFAEIAESVRDEYALTLRAHQKLVQYKIGNGLVDTSQDASPEQWDRLTETLLATFFDEMPVLSVEQYRQEYEQHRTAPNIALLRPLSLNDSPLEKLTGILQLLNVENKLEIAERVDRMVVRLVPNELHETIKRVLISQLDQPSYTRDDAMTLQRREAAYANAQADPNTFLKDTVLVPAETRLEERHVALLENEFAAYKNQRPMIAMVISRLGLLTAIGLLATGVWLFIFQTTPRIPRNPMRGLAVTALMLLCQAMAVIFEGMAPNLTFGAVAFPTLLVAFVLAIVYDRSFAIALGSAHAALVVLTLKLPVEVGMVTVTGVLAAATQLQEVRSRSKIVRVSITAGVGMALAAAAVHLVAYPAYTPEHWQRLGGQLLGVVAAGLGVGVIVQAALPFIESAFHVTTAMTLKELNDASHPLLQRLAQEAPGTYQHSLRIADMAEHAADVIGADGLLARVGAMYHDVGKINKPQYFIENQGGGPNKHSKLNPAMSLLIIVGHVKDGAEMAREYNLPRVVVHFIESHHGTTLVEYFYHAACKQKEAADAQAPSEFEYRYPGPKPQTKEAAIMLLCDGIEGMARTLDEPTPLRLQQMVHNMAVKRLMDGQFDDCSLTLAELSKVEKAITKTLTAIYHTRIKYPQQRPDSPEGTDPSDSAAGLGAAQLA
jgi:hypothetical protein